MGKSNKTTSTTVAQPWAGAEPFLRQLVGSAQSAFQQGLFDVPPFPGIRVAPQSALTAAGQQGIYNVGTQGNPVTPVANQTFADLASGNYINPALSEVRQNILADVVPAVSSRFSNAGMLDSSLAADTIASSAAQALAPFEFNALENAQQRRLGALGMSPELARANFLDPMMLMTAGQGLDAFNQRVLDSAIGSYYEQLNRPFQELQRASSLALGFGGTGGTQSTSQPQNTALQTVGGIMQAVAPLLPFIL